MKHLKKFEGNNFDTSFDFEFIQDCLQELYDVGWTRFGNNNSTVRKISDYIPEVGGKNICKILISHPYGREETTAIHANGDSYHFTKHQLDVDFKKEEEYQNMMIEAKDRLEDAGYIVYFSKGTSWMSVFIIK